MNLFSDLYKYRESGLVLPLENYTIDKRYLNG